MRILVIIISIILISCSNETGKTPETNESMAIRTFEEALNTAVFTTKFVILGKKDITLVRHEPEDGAWIFFSDDKYQNYEEVAKVVGLGEIIKIDSTILEIADLPVGYYATRKSSGEKWQIEKLKGK